MYTEVLGWVSYLASRSRGRKNTVSKALFIPLSALEMEVKRLNKRDSHRIKETHICFLLNDVCCDPVKNVLVFFLSEILFRVVRDMEPDPRLFGYLYESIRLLEYADKSIANFHMVFLLGFLHYFSIFPDMESHGVGYYSDTSNEVFMDHIPIYWHYLNKVESALLSHLPRISFENTSLYGSSRQERARIIYRILEYYRPHFPDFPETKLLSVMQSLFD